LSAKLMGAGRVIAIDTVPSRLEMAQAQQAEIIDFNREDPVETIKRLTGGIGVDRAIDAVGVDAEAPHAGPAAEEAITHRGEFERELIQIAPDQNPQGENWIPGNAPSQALNWAVEALAKAGTLSIIGVYPKSARRFPIGTAMNKNLAINAGNCNHRRYIPQLINLVENGTVDPGQILTQTEHLTDVIDAYKAFDTRKAGWMKVALEPVTAGF
jgi:threonine dehydrogenase-like Zn-dependent dehydrogenase